MTSEEEELKLRFHQTQHAIMAHLIDVAKVNTCEEYDPDMLLETIKFAEVWRDQLRTIAKNYKENMK